MKNVLLLGAGGKTGIWYTQLLLREGYHVFAYDQNYNNAEDIASSISQKNFSIVEDKEYQNQNILKKIDMITLSPGVPLKQPLIETAFKEKKEVFSELDFCLPYLKDKIKIGVTGTDGKSTVVSLIEHILNFFSDSENSKQKALACGNIGTSLSEVIMRSELRLNFEILVIELSSYQLELAKKLELDIGMLLNIAPDHLNRYKSFEEYALVKCGLIKKVKKGGLWITSQKLMKDYPKEMSDEKPEKLLVDTDNMNSQHFFWEETNKNLFSLFECTEPASSLDASHKTPQKKDAKKIVLSNEIPLKGRHNLNNILFALETIFFLRSSLTKKNATLFVKPSLKAFKNLPHRFEYVPGHDPNIIYINDSKATTCQAVRQAIQNVTLGSYLFLGGLGKGEDYTILLPDIKSKKLKLFLFGKEKDRLCDSLHSVGSTDGCEIVGRYESLKEAVENAHKHYEFHKKHSNTKSPKKICFLLSPACTSWDEYSSFEARGDHFKELVSSDSFFV